MICSAIMEHLMAMASSEEYALSWSDYMAEDFRDMYSCEFKSYWFQLESNFCGSEQPINTDFMSPLVAVEWKKDFSDGSPNPPWCRALPWMCLWAAILSGTRCTRQRPILLDMPPESNGCPGTWGGDLRTVGRAGVHIMPSSEMVKCR